MRISFHKYEGTGNDFIIIDNRRPGWLPNAGQVLRMCDRHFGIGADGLMLLNPASGVDFGMTYYNADGGESTMCGNGGRCIIAFARMLGLGENSFRFMAVDGLHEASITHGDHNMLNVSLKMSDCQYGTIYPDGVFIDTGSPHFVMFEDDAGATDVFNKGRQYRYDNRFRPNGVNVDFVQVREDGLFVRTYERGVENETLSCGTGVTAAALVFSQQMSSGKHTVRTTTRGGQLKVTFVKNSEQFTDIWLEGPATHVFSGEIEIS